jgi:hypothetical protein
MSESVTIILQGGLGNQLFQYAAGLAIANINKGELWLNPAELNKHSNKDYRTHLYIRAKSTGINGTPKITTIIEQSNAFSKWNPSDYNTKEIVTLKGYYQYLPAIKPEVSMICNDILEILSDKRKALSEKYLIKDTSMCGFIHIRRGDYLHYSRLYCLQGEFYYTNGIDYIQGELKHIIQWFIVSDDIKWCKAQPWLNSHNYTFVDEPDELDGLMVMSLCEGAAIIANSTYSWWGAMLSSRNKNVPIVYPLKWFKDEKPDLFLPGWKGI